jgi:multiple sugar transport system permease protein
VWGVDIVSLMAASTAVLLPVLIIFFLAQKYFVQGVVMSGIKG